MKQVRCGQILATVFVTLMPLCSMTPQGEAERSSCPGKRYRTKSTHSISLLQGHAIKKSLIPSALYEGDQDEQKTEKKNQLGRQKLEVHGVLQPETNEKQGRDAQNNEEDEQRSGEQQEKQGDTEHQQQKQEELHRKHNLNMMHLETVAWELPGNKKEVDCKNNLAVTIFNEYWKSHNGAGYMSRETTVPRKDAGEIWYLKDAGDGFLVLWCPHWNHTDGRGYKSWGTTAARKQAGEKWKAYQEPNGKVSFYCPYWNDRRNAGWLSGHANTARCDVGEQWIVKTEDNKEACVVKEVSKVKGRWMERGSVPLHRELCLEVGIEKTFPEKEIKTFSEGVSKILTSSSQLKLEIEEGLSHTSTFSVLKEVSKSWSASYEAAYSNKQATETRDCIKPGELAAPAYNFEWQWVFEVTWGWNTVLVFTRDFALTQNSRMRPRCLPGGAADRYKYQSCNTQLSLFMQAARKLWSETRLRTLEIVIWVLLGVTGLVFIILAVNTSLKRPSPAEPAASRRTLSEEAAERNRSDVKHIRFSHQNTSHEALRTSLLLRPEMLTPQSASTQLDPRPQLDSRLSVMDAGPQSHFIGTEESLWGCCSPRRLPVPSSSVQPATKAEPSSLLPHEKRELVKPNRLCPRIGDGLVVPPGNQCTVVVQLDGPMPSSRGLAMEAIKILNPTGQLLFKATVCRLLGRSSPKLRLELQALQGEVLATCYEETFENGYRQMRIHNSKNELVGHLGRDLSVANRYNFRCIGGTDPSDPKRRCTVSFEGFFGSHKVLVHNEYLEQLADTQESVMSISPPAKCYELRVVWSGEAPLGKGFWG